MGCPACVDRRQYIVPLPPTLGVTPTPETPAQPLPVPVKNPYP